MNINFENLEMIEDVYNMLLEMKNESKVHLEKRWLTSEELSEYTGFSQSTIKNLIQSKELEHGIHFYQKIKKYSFDKEKIDEWIMSDNKEKFVNHRHTQRIVQNIFANVA